ncbi:hypothetical protein ABE41_005115 [Fictibacillus arsenicus]|uniref:Uncharacterized protein n=1 Tax=Fictibacillus arsenicus TaxID=255247 RepID=A0A1B1Z1M1_9BACL|nr:hypothetical protein ABE41_005115 [Fictibacillus arsenicus]
MEGARLLRDERSGETTQRREAARGLTARPAESEATWNGNQLLTRATKLAKTAFIYYTITQKDRVARIQLSVHAVHIVFHADHSQFPAVDMQFHANMAKSRLMTSHLSSQKDAWLVKKRDI